MTEARLQEFLSSGVAIKLTLASDGGARDGLGSYGWEIAIGCEIATMAMQMTDLWAQTWIFPSRVLRILLSSSPVPPSKH